MWINGEVQLPEELLEAHAAGELVIFVGAGASLDKPSSLPLFDGLTQQIADHFARTRDDEGYDVFLASLERDGLDIRSEALRILTRADSTPNDNHRALVALAQASGTGAFRIVTTNYDRHLETALAESGSNRPVFSAPALPLGRDFDGIVHLHGAVDRPTKTFVLTARDFGSAYLTDAWAARFLLEVFAHYAVLFVGYSHEDVVMSYLARGLTDAHPRYVLTDVPGNPTWAQLGIIPIEYPASGKDHSALTRALSKWQERATMGALEHRARIRQIVAGEPPLEPADQDYLSGLVRTPLGAESFREFARGRAWLEWANDQETFALAFSPAGDAPGRSEAVRPLAEWFAHFFVSDPELQEDALDIVRRRGTVFSQSLIVSVVSSLVSLRELRPDLANQWLPVVSHSLATDAGSRWLSALFMGMKWPRDRSAILSLLRLALVPRLNLTPAVRWDPTSTRSLRPSTAIQWPVDRYVIATFWETILAPHVASAPDVLLQPFETAIVMVYEQMRAFGGDAVFDFLTFSRQSIETNLQISRGDVEAVALDVIRDIGEVLASLGRSADLESRWWSYDYSIFSRLVVHLRYVRTDLSPNDRIQWLLDNGLLYDFHLKHEVYRTLARDLKDADPPTRDSVIAAALAGPERLRDRSWNYMIFNLLVWITSADPTWREAAEAKQRFEAANPDFAPRKHPDLDHYVEVGSRVENAPESVDQFRNRAEKSAVDALRWLIEQPVVHDPFDGPDWSGPLSLIAGAAASEPILAAALWDASTQLDSERMTGVRSALTGHWSLVPHGTDWAAVLDRLLHANLAEHARDVSEMLDRALREDAWNDALMSIAREIAGRIADTCARDFTYPAGQSGYALGLNTWPGSLARFWTGIVSRVWSADRDGWVGLPADIETQLLQLLEPSSTVVHAAGPILMNDLFFLFAADERFAQETLFPMFEGQGSIEFKRGLWEGFLYGGRVNDRMLSSGFLGLVKRAALLVGDMEQSISANYFELIASIAVFSALSADERRDLLEFVGDSIANGRAHLIVAFGRVLREAEELEIVAAWDSWLESYMERRFEGIPELPTGAETAAWSGLFVPLFPRRQAFLTILAKRPAGFGDEAVALPDVSDPDDESLVAQDPESVLAWLSHLVSGSSELPPLVQYRLDPLVTFLKELLGAIALRPLAALALERGMTSAFGWADG